MPANVIGWRNWRIVAVFITVGCWALWVKIMASSYTGRETVVEEMRKR